MFKNDSFNFLIRILQNMHNFRTNKPWKSILKGIVYKKEYIIFFIWHKYATAKNC